MFDPITEELIKSIPSLNGIDTARLPLELTKIYANIISAKSQLERNALPLLEQDMKKYLTLLDRLVVGLEVLIFQKKFYAQKETLAFVAATAFSLKQLLLSRNKQGCIVNQDYVSSGIMMVLLFLVAKDITDAKENAKLLDGLEEADDIVKLISFLAQGRLDKILLLELPAIKFNGNNYSGYALKLLLHELSIGIKTACQNILDRKAIDYSKIDEVISLSDFEIDGIGQSDTYFGILKVAKILKLALISLNEISVFKIECPNQANSKEWYDFLFSLVQRGRVFLWKNHREAIKCGFLKKGVSSVLTYPTGAGKSTIVDMKIALSLFRGESIVYLVPTHALERQVKFKFSKLFRDFKNEHYLELGGEFSEYFNDETKGQILVSTPERFLTLATNDSEFISKLGLLVFDEFHLIGEQIPNTRGLTGMLSLLLTLAKQNKTDFVLLSAMVKNGKEISEWIQNVTGRLCLCLDDKWKPTRQLQGCLLYQKTEIDALQDMVKKCTKGKGGKKFKENLLVTPYCLFSLKTKWETLNTQDYTLVRLLNHSVRLSVNTWMNLTTNRNEVAANLAMAFAKANLKVLVFVASRKNTTSIQNTVDDEVAGVKISDYCNSSKIRQLKEELGNLCFSYIKLETACAVHHGLMLPEEREIMEACYAKAPINILVATPTLAQGINLPADVVLIAGDDRFDAKKQEVEKLQAHEIMNAVGRAGRAGSRSCGTAILIPGKIVTIDNYILDERWFNIKNTIFSQGDQCLEIEDPLDRLLMDVETKGIRVGAEEEIFIHRLKGDKNQVKSLFRKSFAAYNANTAHKQNEFFDRVNYFVDVLEKKPEKEDNTLWKLSIKTGISVDMLEFLNYFVNTYSDDDLNGIEAIQLVSDFFKSIADTPHYFKTLISNENVYEIICKICGADQEIDADGISKIGDLLRAYISGKSILELENMISLKREEKFLDSARKFVLQVIPSLSYIFGVISQLIHINYMAYGHLEDEVPKDLCYLASLVKEGVDSAAMLRFKDREHLMRVACHNKFKEV